MTCDMSAAGDETPAAIGRGRREGLGWDRTTIIYAMDLWHRRHLRAPTANEWRKAGVDHPTTVTVIKRFGSWNDAMRAAGFAERRRGGAKPGELRGVLRGSGA